MHDSPQRQSGHGCGAIRTRHTDVDARPHVAAHFASRGRKAVLVPLSKVANNRFAFAFLTAAVIAAKVIHILAHQRALSRRNLALWTFSFLAQDFVVLIVVHAIIVWAYGQSTKYGCLRQLTKILVWAFALFTAIISVVNVSFFAHSKSEVRWRNIGFASDSSSRSVLLSGITSVIAVLASLALIAGIFQNVVFFLASSAIDALKWPYTLWKQRRAPGPGKTSRGYVKLDQNEEQMDDFLEKSESTTENGHTKDPINSSWAAAAHIFCRGLWVVVIIGELICCILRPAEGSLTYMSWTAPLLPFIDFHDSASSLQHIQPVLGTSINFSWDNTTTLNDPVSLPWLPHDSELAGFEDWYGERKKHYDAETDPLKKSNLDSDLLPELQDKLSDMKIKHIVLLVLESTRKDVFPIKKDGLIWNRFTNASEDRTLSGDATKRLETLTPMANYLTGDYADGFSHDASEKARGGLNFKDAYTAATYTRKSMVGTLCGVWPLVADFNKEYLHHIYQPCLPQVLEALTSVDKQNGTDDINRSAWRSHYLQSVTLAYDHADVSTEQFGFPVENTVDAGYLRSDSARFGKVDLPDINYFGMAEAPLLDYFRDAFRSAKKKDERVFLTHLTSTTHDPYAMPADETYVPLANGKLNRLSHYVNTVGYVDRWIGKLLDALEQEGVANETLILLNGDHGISLAENDIQSTYYNPNVGCNHVPMVMSHPKLPVINVADSVSTMEILPTVLDLLRETDSLSDAARQAASDLLANYEGRSLIRQLHNSTTEEVSDKTTASDMALRGSGEDTAYNWQFILMNPGRAMLGMRDRRRKHWRITVPVIQNVEWRFNDLEADPTDNSPLQAFDFSEFVRAVEKTYGKAAAAWVEEAAFIARWWVEENNKRWQYGPYRP